MLDTGVRTFKNVDRIRFGSGSFDELDQIINQITNLPKEVIIFLDDYFVDSILHQNLQKYNVKIVPVYIERLKNNDFKLELEL